MLTKDKWTGDWAQTDANYIIHHLNACRHIDKTWASKDVRSNMEVVSCRDSAQPMTSVSEIK